MPRLIASMARLPLPEKRSKTRPPSKKGPIILKMAPLTLSVVGRVVLPSNVLSGRPPKSPATTRKLVTSFLLILVRLFYYTKKPHIDVASKDARQAENHQANTKNSRASRVFIYFTYQQVQSRSCKLRYQLWHHPLRLL